LSVTDNDPSTDLSDVLFGPGMLSNDGLSAEYCYYVGPNNNHNLFGANVVLTFNLQFANGQGCVQQAPGALTPIVSDGAVISNGCSRSQTRTFTATDACGNTATASRTATWTADKPACIYRHYSDVTLTCNSEVGTLIQQLLPMLAAFQLLHYDGNIVTDDFTFVYGTFLQEMDATIQQPYPVR
jgi:hypothetical protein